jgi:ribosomal protein S27AE
MAKQWTCPNCGPGTVTHETEKGIVCEKCGGTFVFTAGEAKLTDVGKLDRLEADVADLKKRLSASSPAALPPEDAENDGTGDPEDECGAQDEDEEDL